MVGIYCEREGEREGERVRERGKEKEGERGKTRIGYPLQLSGSSNEMQIFGRLPFVP